MALRFMEIFRDLNADIVKQLPAIRGGVRNLLDLVLSTTSDNAIPNMAILLDSLKDQIEYGVLYIFDEHNEFYRTSSNSSGSKLDAHFDFLDRFTGWTGPTGGVSICDHF